MKRQIDLFLTALMFYTRLPVPRSLEFSNERLNRSTRYLPLAGGVVGGIGAAVFYGLHLILPVPVAVFLSMMATVLVTGAFHEDGFADFCDGFGGGYTREKIFSIMKDSRIGTYGTIGLVGMLGTKFLMLQAMASAAIPPALVAGHVFSRLMPVLIIFFSHYSREDETSKVKPIGKRGKTVDLVIAVITGLLPLAFLPLTSTIVLLVLSVLLFWRFKRYIEKKINGYTGDCLGALQQMSEVFVYLCLLI